jgi:hypothetical protein
VNEDDWVTCNGCSREVLVSELCDHDAATGPVCLARCCATDHPVGRKPWEAAA